MPSPKTPTPFFSIFEVIKSDHSQQLSEGCTAESNEAVA